MSLVLANVGAIVSGDIANPLARGDTIRVEAGRITAIGEASDVDQAADHVVDVGGATVAPGLIDSHCHPTLGDYSPRQRTADWIESAVHGGVTTFVSAGEVHVPGRPKDAAGAKALAILAAKAWQNVHPAGATVIGGAVLLEPGLVESDFAEMAQAGVGLIGEIGVATVWRPDEAAPLVAHGHANGMRAIMHMGGASVPGSSVIDAETAIKVGADIAGHSNGGPTAPALADIRRLFVETQMTIEIVHCGNVRAAANLVALAVELDALDRIVIGTDNPSGTGINPLGVLRVVAWASSLGGIDATLALACATGNTARAYGLAGGRLAEGEVADLVVLDAPRGSQATTALEALEIGDTPAVGAVITGGVVRVHGSRNTPPASRPIAVDGHGPAGH